MEYGNARFATWPMCFRRIFRDDVVIAEFAVLQHLCVGARP